MAFTPLALEQREDESEDALLAALGDGAQAISLAGIRYVVVGGIASSIHGRPRWTKDVDFLVAPDEAQSALQALGRAGFAVEETNPHWIFKATRDGITLDLLFAAKGGIYLDDEMVRRASTERLGGRPVCVAAPEDVVVMKAVAHDEPSARHWHDALGIIAAVDLDWEYLLERGRRGARRLLSLLVYAQSDDLVVPDRVIRRLVTSLYDA